MKIKHFKSAKHVSGRALQNGIKLNPVLEHSGLEAMASGERISECTLVLLAEVTVWCGFAGLWCWALFHAGI